MQKDSDLARSCLTQQEVRKKKTNILQRTSLMESDLGSIKPVTVQMQSDTSPKILQPKRNDIQSITNKTHRSNAKSVVLLDPKGIFRMKVTRRKQNASEISDMLSQKSHRSRKSLNAFRNVGSISGSIMHNKSMSMFDRTVQIDQSHFGSTTIVDNRLDQMSKMDLIIRNGRQQECKQKDGIYTHIVNQQKEIMAQNDHRAQQKTLNNHKRSCVIQNVSIDLISGRQASKSVL